MNRTRPKQALCLAALIGMTVSAGAGDLPALKALFLGDRGHHQPAERFRQLQPPFAARSIALTYTENPADLNPQTLGAYDALIVYANTTSITPEQEKALLDYVEGGKAFVPLHCASYCFLNSAAYVDLVGAQFQRHGTGTFRVEQVLPDHAVLKGFKGFESWDETYVHHRHNEKDRTVLEQRAEGEGKEPWTWVRTQGKGRVFYTAWGHDERTWGNPGFLNLVERGLRWAAGQDPAAVPAFSDQPEMTPKRTDVKPFTFIPANVPYYPAGERWGVTGEPIKKMQAPLDAEESMKHFVTPVGFEVRLFATEPMIGGKPICIAWDERGRAWIAETFDYPNEIQAQGAGRDRIRIIEDVDGDGKADKSTVFSDKLSIPTSIAFAQGGVIAHEMPQTVFLKDTNGDDVADEKHVLFTGWSTGDTHAGPSNLHYGFDNWLYGIVGYSGFDGLIGGERTSFRTGFYRFKPDGSRLEFLRNTNNNSWGVGFSEKGTLFGSTANGNPSEYMPIANRYYEAVRGWSSNVLRGIAGNPRFNPVTENVRQVDFHGRFTAAAGHALYTARAYPREYWDRMALVCEPTGHLIATFQLQPAGSGFTSRIGWNLLASDDEWSAPILAEVGPDGNVWVLDWYNFIVQHNPTPAGFKTGKGSAYETELRDKTHGRIYRVVHSQSTPQPPTSLKDATPERLVETLKNDNLFWRRHAQRLLVERGKTDVAPALLKLVADASLDGIDSNPGAIHALWTLQGLGALDGSNAEALAAATGALKHPAAAVRRNAVQSLPRTAPVQSALLAAGLLRDADGQTRLQAALALAEMPASPEAARAIAEAVAGGGQAADRWMSDALTAAAAAHAEHFLQAIAAAPIKDPAPETLGAIKIAAEHFARGKPVDSAPRIIASLAGAPSMPAAEAILSGMSRGWPKSAPANLDAAIEEKMLALLKTISAESRGAFISLALRMGSKQMEAQTVEIANAYMATVREAKESDAARARAAAQLIEFRIRDEQAAADLLGLITPQTSPDLARGLLEAAGRSEAPQVGESIKENLAKWTPGLRQAAIRTLLGREDWTQALLQAIDDGQVQLSELSLDQKQSLTTHPNKEIARMAREKMVRGGSLPNEDRQKVLDDLLPLARKSGNPVLGKEVFKTYCAKCHTHSGEGAHIGPDLTGMAVHPKAELLLQVIDPNRSVEGNYRVYSVIKKNQQVISGLLASENKTAVEIFDAEGQKHVVLREDIRQLVASRLSLMPEGFEKQISPDNLVHLLDFLTQRGKYLPVPLNKAATVVSTRGMFINEGSDVERLIFPDWTPKSFDGVPFYLIDPQDGRIPNAILFYAPTGTIPPRMPKSVKVPCNAPAKAIHLLSGVSGWGYPFSEKGTVTLVVRLHYADGKSEDHPLKNGEEFADYIRRVDVPGSKFAFRLRGQQIRFLSVMPKRPETIEEIEFVKGPDATAPVIMAVTIESL